VTKGAAIEENYFLKTKNKNYKNFLDLLPVIKFYGILLEDGT
jgi:hypothetical protein